MPSDVSIMLQVSRSSDGGSNYDTDIVTDGAYGTTFIFDDSLTPASLYYYKVQSFYRGGGSDETVSSACTRMSCHCSVFIASVSNTAWGLSPWVFAFRLSGFLLKAIV